ncbi:MAG: hypothetical protein AAF385_10585 [Pseudomonadota bacterium]
MFGVGGFLMAYHQGGQPMVILIVHAGFACSLYLLWYVDIFGFGKVKWMVINATLGLFGIYAQLGWILGLFGADIGDYPWYRHFFPAFYYVLYTFLLHQTLLDITKVRHDPFKKMFVNGLYVFGSTLGYSLILFVQW